MQRKSKQSKAPVAASVKPEAVKPQWKKITRGTLYPFANQRNRRVKPNEVIFATEEEISKFKEHFELVAEGTGTFKPKTAKPKAKPAITLPPAKVEKDKYELIPAGDEMFNVVSSVGKVMNDAPLVESFAQELKASLEKETVEE